MTQYFSFSYRGTSLFLQVKMISTSLIFRLPAVLLFCLSYWSSLKLNIGQDGNQWLFLLKEIQPEYTAFIRSFLSSCLIDSNDKQKHKQWQGRAGQEGGKRNQHRASLTESSGDHGICSSWQGCQGAWASNPVTEHDKWLKYIITAIIFIKRQEYLW